MADLPLLFSEQIAVFVEDADLVVFVAPALVAVPVVFADFAVDADLVVLADSVVDADPVVLAVLAEGVVPVVQAVPADIADSGDSSAPGDIAHRGNCPGGTARSDSNSDYTAPADICSADVCVLPAEL